MRLWNSASHKFKDMKVLFQNHSSKESGGEKNGYIGIYENRKSGEVFEEAFISKNWDSEEKELYIDVNTKAAGRLIHVEAVNWMLL